jgi:hypothetical protein
VTEAEWLSCTNPLPMLRQVDSPSSFRKLVLFGCASCRHSWRSLDEESKETVEAAETNEDHFWNGANVGLVVMGLMDDPVRCTPADRIRFTDLLRCIFGNPFRPSPPLPATVLAWNDGTVRRIAEGIYEQRRMPDGTLDSGRLAILADALLDAGCGDEDLIQHFRSEGPHVRGCWAVDLILGEE